MDEKKDSQEGWKGIELYNADPDCEHEIVELWSGIKCDKCRGWFCY